jgi:hypothetical protein
MLMIVASQYVLEFNDQSWTIVLLGVTTTCHVRPVGPYRDAYKIASLLAHIQHSMPRICDDCARLSLLNQHSRQLSVTRGYGS